MCESHPGKMRPWFNDRTGWNIVEFDVLEDLENLVFLECPWTINERLVIPGEPDYRLLKCVVANAFENHYLDRQPSDSKHRTYYEGFKSDSIDLIGSNRIAICSAEPNEIAQNPSAHYYLLDGVGRCLPYLMLLQEERQRSMKIEAFVAERSI
jgi:hypothetical protein